MKQVRSSQPPAGYVALQQRDRAAPMGVDGKRLELVAAGLMTVAQVQELLSLGRSKIYCLMDSGALPFVKIGRSRRIPRQAVLELAAAHLRGELGEASRDRR